ncbi:DMT family transporter [Moraxella nasovis]|uniref:DMT family transporter n=1 Tax=Moraxella nasovis TaxID=2904121 RepID=UPI001F610E6D|nr:DMT family transporter [Moraxella nasovis]UNU73702.1 DMT family transporter [Moraxella nasovis]
MNKYIFGALICISLLALGGIFVRYSALEPINTAFYRVLFALPIFYILCKRNKKSSLSINNKHKLFAMLSGVFLALDLVLWNISFSYTTVVNANLLSNLVALTVVPISYYLFKEKPTLSFLISAPVMVFGVVLLFLEKAQLGSNHTLGNLLALATSFFYGLFLVTVYKLRKDIDFMVIMYYSCIGSIIALIPFVLFEGFSLPTSINAIIPLLGLAIFSHVLGQGGMSYFLGHLTAISASLIVLSQPAISALYAYVLFGEYLTKLQFIAIIIIMLGLFIGKLNDNTIRHLLTLKKSDSIL